MNFLLLVVIVCKRFLAEGASDSLLGLLPIRSIDESTEKSKDGGL